MRYALDLSVRSALGIALTLSFAHADVHVVDDSGGADFTEIQDAVNAAADGDTVLVKTGDYSAVEIVNKGVLIVADEDQTVRIVGGVRVVDTLVPHEVVLAGMRIDGVHDSPGTTREALTLSVARGPVRVEDCELNGAEGVGYSLIEWGAEAATVSFSLDVSFVSCTFRGGKGEMSFSGFDDNRGGDGLQSTNSKIALHDCVLIGGDGGEGDFLGCDYGGEAGHGTRVTDTVLYASGNTMAGGDGGGDDFFACQAGGHGLFLIGGSTEATLLDNNLSGGLGACGAPNGLPLEMQGGPSITDIPGSARRMAAPTPAREGEVVFFTFEGLPGESAFVLFSLTPAFDESLPFNGVLLLQQPLAQGRRFMGTIPGTGTLVKSIQLPVLAPSLESFTFYIQSLFQGQEIFLASPSSLIVLDSAF